MVNWDGILVMVNALVAYQELKKYVDAITMRTAKMSDCC